MRGDHVLVILIIFSADHVRGAFLIQSKAFDMGYLKFVSYIHTQYKINNITIHNQCQYILYLFKWKLGQYSNIFSSIITIDKNCK